MMPCISWPRNWGTLFTKGIFFPEKFPKRTVYLQGFAAKKARVILTNGPFVGLAKMAKTPRLHCPGYHAARPRSMCRAFAAILGNGYCQAPRMLVIFPWFTWAIFNRSVGNCLPNLHICNWFIRVEKCASPNKFLAGVAGLMACGLIALGIRKPLSYTEIA